MSLKLPKVDYWYERIDATMIAVFAQRQFDDAPRYSTFLMFQCPAGHRPGWAARDQVREKLEAFEAEQIKKYGRRFFRQWQEDVRAYGLTD